MKIIFGILCLLLSFTLVYTKLILVHTLFRHGERTPDNFTMYPTDPYKNETFYPYGTGQLTKEGMQTVYNLGKALRERYDEFLNDTYTPDVLDPWASYLPRTQMSLQLLLSSLFPPRNFQIWKEGFEWQPIPYQFMPKENDYLLLGILSDEFKRMYYEYCKTDKAKEAMKEAIPLFPYIREHAGSPGKTTREFFYIYVTLKAERTFGLKLPKWAEKIYPRPLVDMMALEFYMQMGTKELRQKIIGNLMKKILDDTENRISGKTNTKLHLYSAHDVNMAHILILLDLMYNHVPDYGACLILEVHEENREHFIKVFYKETKHSDFELLLFPKGRDRMYLDKFRNIVGDVYSEEEAKSTGRKTTFDYPKEESSGGSRKSTSFLRVLFVILCCCYSKYLFI